MWKRTLLVTIIVGLGATLVVSRARAQAKKVPVQTIKVRRSDNSGNMRDPKLWGIRAATFHGQSLSLKHSEMVLDQPGQYKAINPQAIDLQALKAGDKLSLDRKILYRHFVVEDGKVRRGSFVAWGDVSIAIDSRGDVRILIGAEPSTSKPAPNSPGPSANLPGGSTRSPALAPRPASPRPPPRGLQPTRRAPPPARR